MSQSQANASVVPSIEFDTVRLTNGLQLILHEDRKLPVVHVNLWYHVGSKNEKAGKTGFAHLFEHMMFEGSRNVKGEFISLMERAGANLSQGGINGTTNFDRTNYFETLPSGSLELVLWAESDRMAYLLDAVNQENLDNQRDVVKNERRQSMDNVPYGTAVEIIFQNLFPEGHPYSWHIIGSMEDLSNASLSDVHDFFRTFYVPNNCTLTIAGRFDADEVKELVERYFGPIAPGPPLQRPEQQEIALERDKRVRVFDRIPQDRLYLVWPAVAFFERDDAPLDVLTTILSDGKNSRLYKRLVYDEQVASDVSAFNYSLEIAGLVGVVATARPGVSLSELESQIEDEIQRFANEGPTDEELARVKVGREVELFSGLERIGGFGGKADRLNLYNTYLGSPGFFVEDFDRYQRLNLVDVQRVANDYLLKPRLTVSFLREGSLRSEKVEPDRSMMPEIKPTVSFEVPDVHTVVLDNGLKLHVTSRHEVPKIGVALIVKAGAIWEPMERIGLAAMTAEMLVEGTASRSALQIEAELDRMGSQLSSGGSREWSLVSMNCLKRYLPKSLELMVDVALHPNFPDDELERLRKQYLDNILQDRSNASAIASRIVRMKLFGAEHPYGWPIGGTVETVTGMKRSELERFYLQYFRPESSALIMVGDVDAKEATALAEGAFGSWSGEQYSKATLGEANRASRETFLVDRPGAAQSELRLAMLGPPRSTGDYYVLEMLNNVLGGGFSGRLNLNLREDKGFTYGAFSGIRYACLQSLLLGSAPVESSVTGLAIEEMLSEFDALASWRRPITEGELTHAREALTRGFAQRFETLAQVAGEVAELEGYDIPLSNLAAYPDGIASVTLEQLGAAAAQYLDTSKAVLVVVGDGERIMADVESLGFGPMYVLDPEGQPV